MSDLKLTRQQRRAAQKKSSKELNSKINNLNQPCKRVELLSVMEMFDEKFSIVLKFLEHKYGDEFKTFVDEIVDAKVKDLDSEN